MPTSYGFLHVIQAIHGDAFMMEFDQPGQTSVFMLVDGGPGQSYNRSGNDYSTTNNLFELLNNLSNRTGQRRLEYIDTVIVTHDDEDHKNGIADLFRFLLQTTDKPPTVSWPTGLNLMKGDPRTAPVRQIWYNSQANLIQRYISTKKPIPKNVNLNDWVDKGIPKNGWFDTLLENYKKDFSSPLDISFNKDFKPEKQVGPLINRGIRARPLGTNIVRRGPYAFKFLGPDLQKELINDSLITQLLKASKREGDRVCNEQARPNSRGGGLLTSATVSKTSDYSAKNRSSIAFLAFNQDQKSAGVADIDVPSLLMLGDAAIASQFDKKEEHTIIKIAHHGSAHNNYALPKKLGLSYTEIKLSDGLLNDAFRFFNYVRAKKYVISASPTEGSPNPHFTTVLGIYLAAVELRRKVDVYMTNEFPRNALEAIMFFLTDPEDAKYPGKKGKDDQILKPGVKFSVDLISRLKDFDKHMRIWLLKPSIPYGSIPIDDSSPSTDSWIPVTNNVLRFAFVRPNFSLSAIAAHQAMRSTIGTAAPPPKKKP